MTIALEYGVPTDRSGVNVRFGIEKGFFEEEGIDLSVRVVFGGPEIAAAYDTGELSIGELGTPPGITAIGHGKRFRIVGSGMARGVGLFLLVNPAVRNWDDLRGKTLGALSIGSCSYWYLRDLLQQNGLDPDKDVSIRGLNADYSRQLDLFANGEIHALLSAEPNGALGEAKGIVKVWGSVFDHADVPELQWSIQVANVDFLKEYPSTVQAVLRAANRSARYLIEHPQEWIDYYAELFQIPRDVAEIAIRRDLPYQAGDGRIDSAGLTRAVDLQLRLGAIPRPLSHAELFAEDYALVAAQ